MSVIENFLKSLNDAELAFLHKYKYPGYFERSQYAVKQEIANRGLSTEKMNSYIEQYEFNVANTGCPRCNSENRICQVIEFTKNPPRWSKESMEMFDVFLLNRSAPVTQDIECAVCGFQIYNGNEGIPSSYFWDALKRFIGWRKK